MLKVAQLARTALREPCSRRYTPSRAPRLASCFVRLPCPHVAESSSDLKPSHLSNVIHTVVGRAIHQLTARPSYTRAPSAGRYAWAYMPLQKTGTTAPKLAGKRRRDRTTRRFLRVPRPVPTSLRFILAFSRPSLSLSVRSASLKRLNRANMPTVQKVAPLKIRAAVRQIFSDLTGFALGKDGHILAYELAEAEAQLKADAKNLYAWARCIFVVFAVGRPAYDTAPLTAFRRQLELAAEDVRRRQRAEQPSQDVIKWVLVRCIRLKSLPLSSIARTKTDESHPTERVLTRRIAEQDRMLSSPAAFRWC